MHKISKFVGKTENFEEKYIKKIVEDIIIVIYSNKKIFPIFF